MNEFISVLCESISTNGLWSTFLSCIPLLAITVLFGLGFFVIIKTIHDILPGRRPRD